MKSKYLIYISTLLIAMNLFSCESGDETDDTGKLPQAPVDEDTTVIDTTVTGSDFFFYYDVVDDVRGSYTYDVRLLGGVTEEDVAFSGYGGNLDREYTSTGYYYRHKGDDGYWCIVDPLGYEFLTIGLNSVTVGGDIELPKAVRDISCNTMGCWSEEEINDEVTGYNKMAYCLRWNFMATYKNESDRTKALFDAGIIPVFDPEYVTFCDTHAQDLSATASDPYLFGHFSDNELTIYSNTTYGDLLERFLSIEDKTDANYLAADAWMKERKGDNYTIDEQDDDEFHGYLLSTYYRITGEAIKRYDPNHLYIGSRLHGAAKDKEYIYTEAAQYVDLISINFYSAWEPTTEDMDRWSAGDVPFFITEFYVKGDDLGFENEDGAGWVVPTQTDRAKSFENFTLKLLEHPGCVGYHYFRYNDKNGSNQGLLSEDYTFWYQELVDSFDKIGRDVYALRDYLKK